MTRRNVHENILLRVSEKRSLKELDVKRCWHFSLSMSYLCNRSVHRHLFITVRRICIMSIHPINEKVTQSTLRGKKRRKKKVFTISLYGHIWHRVHN